MEFGGRHVIFPLKRWEICVTRCFLAIYMEKVHLQKEAIETTRTMRKGKIQNPANLEYLDPPLDFSVTGDNVFSLSVFLSHQNDPCPPQTHPSVTRIIPIGHYISYHHAYSFHKILFLQRCNTPNLGKNLVHLLIHFNHQYIDGEIDRSIS